MNIILVDLTEQQKGLMTKSIIIGLSNSALSSNHRGCFWICCNKSSQ